MLAALARPAHDYTGAARDPADHPSRRRARPVKDIMPMRGVRSVGAEDPGHASTILSKSGAVVSLSCSAAHSEIVSECSGPAGGRL
eukprot:3363514-Pyramimonas_sp.AAC.1